MALRPNLRRPAPASARDKRLHTLLTDRAVHGLDGRQWQELALLLGNQAADPSYEQAAAAIELALLPHAAAMPPAIERAVLEQAADHWGFEGERARTREAALVHGSRPVETVAPVAVQPQRAWSASAEVESASDDHDAIHGEDDEEADDEEAGDEEAGDEEAGDEEADDEEADDEEADDEEADDEEADDEEAGDEDDGEDDEEEDDEEEDTEEGDDGEEDDEDEDAAEVGEPVVGDAERVAEADEEEDADETAEDEAAEDEPRPRAGARRRSKSRPAPSADIDDFPDEASFTAGVAGPGRDDHMARRVAYFSAAVALLVLALAVWMVRDRPRPPTPADLRAQLEGAADRQKLSFTGTDERITGAVLWSPKRQRAVATVRGLEAGALYQLWILDGGRDNAAVSAGLVEVAADDEALELIVEPHLPILGVAKAFIVTAEPPGGAVVFVPEREVARAKP